MASFMPSLSGVRRLVGEKDEGRVVPVEEDGAGLGETYAPDECARDCYELARYGGLRRESRHLLRMASDPLEQSLTELGEALDEAALELHDKIWAYATATAPRPELGAAVVERGLQTEALRDEIYCQIMALATGNPIVRSLDALWKLFCACAVTFPPSHELAKYCFHFCYTCDKREPRPSHDYASFGATAMLGCLEAGAAYAVAPSAEDMAAYDERPPCVIAVELADGSPLAPRFPVTPQTPASKVAEILGRVFLQLKDNRAATFGLFVVADGDSIPLGRSDYPGDAARGWAPPPHVVYKRLALFADEPSRSSDATFEMLTYAQAEDAVLNEGCLPVSDAAAAELAAFGLAVSLGEDVPTTVDGLLAMEDITIAEFFPPRFEQTPPAELAKKALARLPDPATPLRVLHRSFVDVVKKLDLYGAHFFRARLDAGHAAQSAAAIEIARRLPDDGVLVAVNALGLWLFDPVDHAKLLDRYARNEVCSWERPDARVVAVKVQRAGDDAATFVFGDRSPGAAAGLAASLDAYARPRVKP